MAAGIFMGAQPQFFDSSGNPLALGSLTFYATGTTTFKKTYKEFALTNENDNPMTLDAAGRPEFAIYGTGAYKVIVKNAAGVQAGDTQDPVYFVGNPSGIGVGTITSAMIADGTIVAGDIAAATITGAKIAVGTITSANIENATIQGADIAAATIVGSNIALLTVDTANIAAAAITTSKIDDLQVTTDKLDNLAVTTGKLGAASVTTAKIGALQVTADEIANATITGAKIGNLEVKTANIDNLAVTSGKIGNAEVKSGNIEDGAITTGKIGNLQVQAGKIDNLTITAAQIANLTITGGAGGKIATSTITDDNIVARAISAASIAAGTITADELAADSIIASKILADTIRASHIDVGLFLTFPSDENLVAYYKFDEVSGTLAVDSTSNGYNLTMQNIEDADWVQGVAGNCINLDGAAEYGEVNHAGGIDFTNSDLTISAWVKHGGQNAWRSICANSVGQSVTRQFAFAVDTSDVLHFFTWDGVNFVSRVNSGANTVSANVLHHVAVVFDDGAGTATLYLDGEPVGTASGLNSMAYSPTYLGVGARLDGAEYFDGKIDELRIYSSALTPAEVRALFLYPSGNESGIISGNTIAANTITATQIAAGTITTNELNFTPATSTNVIATINASPEGIAIEADNIAIAGTTTFTAGWAAAANAEADINVLNTANAPAEASADVTGDHTAADTALVNGLAAANVAGWAHGSDITKIDGGDIYTNTITASQINGAGFGTLTITSGKIVIETTDGLEITGTGNVKILAGGDMILVNDHPNPAKLIFRGITTDIELYGWDNNDTFYITPIASGYDLRVGNSATSYWDDIYIESSNALYLRNYSSTAGIVSALELIAGEVSQSAIIKTSDNAGGFAQIALQSVTATHASAIAISGNSLYPASDSATEFGITTNRWSKGWFDELQIGAVTLSQLTDNSMVDALHRHSELSASDGTPDRALVVDATGLVGIGTVGPAYPLDIESSLNTIIRVKSTDNRAAISVEDDDTQAAFGVEDGSAFINVGGGSLGSAELVIDSIGRIGIGTISPDTKLQVVGNCKFGDDDTNYTLISTTGVLALVGTARAWKSRDLDPTSVRTPGANAPANDQIDNFDFHRYDRSTEESVFFHWGVPDDYGEGTANVRGQFKFLVENPPVSPAGDEVVVMGFEYKVISEGEVFDFTGGTTSGTLTETIVEDETASIHHLTAYGTLDTTGLVHGDTILFRFFRDATNVADTYDNEGAPADNDVWVWDYHLEYITDKFGHAL